MKLININLIQEEMETLNKSNGKKVGIYDDGKIKVVIMYDKLRDLNGKV
jgi:hypothetical protein|tara:strand:- start:934 stop:1080 length:147 start_codon:yes stop_codon:yes gene_type:complete